VQWQRRRQQAVLLQGNARPVSQRIGCKPKYSSRTSALFREYCGAESTANVVGFADLTRGTYRAATAQVLLQVQQSAWR
jgi:hypothetical protein